MKYFRQRWDESRDDKYESWGSAWWLFEADVVGIVFRQVEQYDNGQVNRYDKRHLQDKYGGLSEKPLDLDGFKHFEISREEFETVWNKATNGKS
jgi:hypothetical protein